jgi:hypothetical protein
VGGAIRHSSHSRARHLAWGAKLRKLGMLLGGLLVVNASIPPVPSFFSEVYILVSLLANSLLRLLFILLRAFVCYYNLIIFTHLSQVKSVVTKPFSPPKVIEDGISCLNLLRGVSLTWLSLFLTV